MPPQPRRIADRYEIRPLNGGGMGTIWRAYDTVLDRLVAIKQIRSDRHQSAERRSELADRFRREARVTAKIEHPGVPAVYDAAIDRDTDDVEQLYLVMQLVHGHTIADILDEQGPLSVPWAVAIAAQVCAVLSHAHAIPVVHRDLKPSNVMMDRDGHVKVLDFGVAAVLGTDVTQLTETGQLVGSRQYMSPEQFHGVGVSPRSDLYAVGCLLHEMLTGRKVFDGVGDPALQHVHHQPTPLRVLRPEVDEAIERLVLDLLAKSPDERPASAREVFDRLLPFLPLPGSDGKEVGDRVGSVVDGVADPTRPYRYPLTPRRPAAPPAAPPVAPKGDTEPAPARSSTRPGQILPALVELLDAVEQRANALVDEDRFAQAAGLLEDVLRSPEIHAVAEHPRVLDSRTAYAATLLLGGEYRRALTMFDELAHAFAKAVGPGDERVVECRTQAAYCHVALGNNEAALTAFRALLEDVRRDGGDRNENALELRREIGERLLAENRLQEAIVAFRQLLPDLIAARGADDPAVREIRGYLVRIELTGGTWDR